MTAKEGLALIDQAIQENPRSGRAMMPATLAVLAGALVEIGESVASIAKSMAEIAAAQKAKK